MHKCIACGLELDERSHLLFCANMPASAQDIPSKEELASERPVGLQLCQCPGCGLVQFDCEPVSYYRDVISHSCFSLLSCSLQIVCVRDMRQLERIR